MQRGKHPSGTVPIPNQFGNKTQNDSSYRKENPRCNIHDIYGWYGNIITTKLNVDYINVFVCGVDVCGLPVSNVSVACIEISWETHTERCIIHRHNSNAITKAKMYY